MPSDVLPYAADVNDSLPSAELSVLRQQYEHEDDRGHLSVQTKFNLAWGLVKSNLKEETEEGVLLMMDIYRQEATRRRECLYYLALGMYKLKQYAEAKRYNGRYLLLEREPSNLQARSLKTLIERDVSREGYIGVALLGGVAAALTGIAFTFMRNSSSRT